VPTAWFVLLGLFFAAYLVLGGADYGVGILTARFRAEPAGPRPARTPEPGREPEPAVDPEPTPTRRGALTALGPFFLGNEVWLVATAGLLLGAFPLLEGELLAGLYPTVVVALAGVVMVTAAVPLRSRPAHPRWRRRWDRLLVLGGILAAAGWGATLGGLLQGVPLAPDAHLAGVAEVVTPFTVAAGLAMVTLVAVHGAAFLALRLPTGPAHRTARLGRRLVPVALAALGAATVLGLLSDRVRQAAHQPIAAFLLPVLVAGTLLLARRLLGRRPGLAFAATSAALAAPVPLIGATTWPYALVSSLDPGTGLTVADAAAGAPTLELLGWLVGPLLPLLLACQVLSWWIFRGRLDSRTPVYW
jgi:cytochrome d ubiquinol oxidase subunit II